MAAGIAKELPDSPQGSISNDKATFTRKFQVECTSLYDGPITVLNAVGVPRPQQLYAFGAETHTLARVKDRDAERVAPNSKVWVVTVKYESSEEDEEDPTDPLLEPAEIALTFENQQEVVKQVYDEYASDHDDFSDAVRNSAGELFNPPPLRDISRPVLTISRNEDMDSPIRDTAIEYVNSTNNAEWGGAGVGKARMMGIDVSREWKEVDDEGTKVAYLKCTYRIMFDPRGWDLNLLDHGSYYWEGSTKKFFKSEDGHPHLDLLDGAGGRGTTPTFLPAMQIYPRKDWDALNLPENWSDIWGA